MIIHKLILRHLKTKDDSGFYALQAQDAIHWLIKKGVVVNGETSALDLGCGHGIFGAELKKMGAKVSFADEDCFLSTDLADAHFQKINIDRDDLSIAGKHDLVICSNVYEHLSKPIEFLKNAHRLLNKDGFFYLSWTNWLSPWGGHEFSPFHYLGAKRGHLLYDKWTGRARIHTPFVNLFPTYIGQTVQIIKNQTQFRVVAVAPRYYPELSIITKLPWIREFFSWNCAILMQTR